MNRNIKVGSKKKNLQQISFNKKGNSKKEKKVFDQLFILISINIYYEQKKIKYLLVTKITKIKYVTNCLIILKTILMIQLVHKYIND